MKHVSTRTTYLQMLRPRMPAVAVPRADVRLHRERCPSIEFYRFLYDAVGAAHHWVDRKLLGDEQLERILTDAPVEVFVLRVGHAPAGFSELDRRRSGEIELAYIGLLPQFVGQGLGRYLLDWTLRQAWSYCPRRVWVHTCDLDHPAALPLYLKAGFTVYDERVIQQAVLGD